MSQIGPAAVAIVSGIIGLAIIAVLVSTNAQTGTVISQTGGALSSIINAAVSPVAGSSSNGFGAAAGTALFGARLLYRTRRSQDSVRCEKRQTP